MKSFYSVHLNRIGITMKTTDVFSFKGSLVECVEVPL